MGLYGIYRSWVEIEYLGFMEHDNEKCSSNVPSLRLEGFGARLRIYKGQQG